MLYYWYCRLVNYIRQGDRCSISLIQRSFTYHAVFSFPIDLPYRHLGSFDVCIYLYLTMALKDCKQCISFSIFPIIYHKLIWSLNLYFFVSVFNFWSIHFINCLSVFEVFLHVFMYVWDSSSPHQLLSLNSKRLKCWGVK